MLETINLIGFRPITGRQIEAEPSKKKRRTTRDEEFLCGRSLCLVDQYRAEMYSHLHSLASTSTSTGNMETASSNFLHSPNPSRSNLFSYSSRQIMPELSQSDESKWFNAAGILLSLKNAAIERRARLENHDENENRTGIPAAEPPSVSGKTGHQPVKPESNHVTRMQLKWRGNQEEEPPRSSQRGRRGTETLVNQCRVCFKIYARPSTLRMHMRTHRGEKPFKCQICFKSFTQDANLTAHLRIHSGEKPFKCQVCGRRFAQSSSVTTHMRTHTGERPYPCRVCSRAFADSSTLTKHMRTHTGEKPYQCRVCHMRFSQSGNLNRHMRVHLNDKLEN